MRFLGIAALSCAALVSSVASAEPYRLIQLGGYEMKWGVPERGLPAEVSYRLVDREVRFDGAVNCGAMQPIGPMLGQNGIAPAAFAAELEAAFAAWTAIAGIRFVPADNGRADILIGAQSVPRGRAYTNVEYDLTTARDGVATLTRSLVCFNPEHRWKIGFDGDLDSYDLRYVLLHEIGHAIGLNHSDDPESLMYRAYSEKFRLPQAGDAAGAVAVYGQPSVPAVAARSEPDTSAELVRDGGPARAIR